MMKRIWRRAVSVLLAAQLLAGSTGSAMAATTQQPYNEIYFNVGHSPYAGSAVEGNLLDVEGSEDRTSSTSSWAAASDGSYTLNSITSTSFPKTATGRIPDRIFAGWTVFTGVKPDADNPANFFVDQWAEGTGIIGLDQAISPGDFVKLINKHKNELNNAEWTDSDLPLVGRWVLSNDARLLPSAPLKAGGEASTGFSTGIADSGCDKLYKDDITGLSQQALKEENSVPFTSEQKEYWLRVTTGVDKLDLTAVAAEPYCFEGATQAEQDRLNALPEGKKPGVHLSLTDAAGKTTTIAPEKTVLNIKETARDSWVNSADHPARSQWVFRDIPLAQSAGEGHYCNDVTLTVIAPDGTTEATYVFHIQRLGEPSLLAAPGNTPFGMLERDTGDNTADKSAVKAEFEVTRKFSALYLPSGAENNNGAVYYAQDAGRARYTKTAWIDDFDPDLDETALVVYQDSTFTVPGFTVKDSAGNTVGGADYPATMGYSLALRLVDTLSVSSAIGTPGTVNSYNGTGLTAGTIDPVVISREDGAIAVNLSGANVAPGIYSLEYEFKDPVSGNTYTSDPEKFNTNKGNAVGFARAVIVLPIPGDVDMDGAVTVNDALTMEHILVSDSDFMKKVNANDATACLFAYRVCDVNEDGVFDEEDVKTLWKGYAPQVKRSVGNSDYFYLPLPTEVAVPQRKEPAAATEEKPTLTLDYLGATPENLTPEQLTEGLKSGDLLSRPAEYGDGVKLDDVFWVGVRLTLPNNYSAAGGSALAMGISAATISVAYDSTLVEPAVLDETWAETMRLYNLGTGATGVSTNYMWSADYALTDGSGMGGQYSYKPNFDPIGPAKAIVPLEATAGGDIRELRLSIRQTGDVRRVLLTGTQEDKNILLLRVPFKVISHPHGQKEMRALDLSLGQRELAFGGVSQSEAAAALWDTRGEPIFGAVTGNLAREIAYGGGTALVLTLGEDKTDYLTLVNTLNNAKTIYGESFSAQTNTGGMTEEEKKNLPRGLTYAATGADAGYIKGIPEETGIFRFYVSTQPYELTVEKAPLELTVLAQRAYYGENLPALRFTYNKEQIKALDKLNGANHQQGFVCDGEGEELPKLGGFVSAPAIAAVTTLEGDAAVAAGTPVGKYYITIQGGENKNYKYTYAKAGYGGETAFVGGYHTLELLPRPVVVEKLNKGQASLIATILYDSLVTRFQMTAVYKGGEFAVRRGGTAGTPYGGLPLSDFGVYSDDQLEIGYQADYIRNAGDTSTTFVLKTDEEYRDIKISNMSFTTGGTGNANTNYVLVDPKLDSDRVADGGKVVNRPATKVELVKGVDTEYGNGAGLNLAGMVIRITYGRDQDTNEVTLAYETSRSFTERSVQVTWEDTPNGAAPTPGHDVMEQIVNGNEELFELAASQHSGKYICVWVPTSTVSGSTNYVMAAMTKPLKVNKTKLTLTLTRMGRYYGEENPQIIYTYSPKMLSPDDYNLIKSRLGKDPTGLGSELAHLWNNDPRYSLPKIELREGVSTEAKPLVPDTTAVQGRYLSIISGGGAPNVDFQFSRTGTEVKYSDFGYEYFDIYPRPIVIDEVVMANGETDSDYFLYDDTNTTRLVTMSYTTENGVEKRKPTATAAGTTKGGVEVDKLFAVLPSNVDKSYFPAGGSNDKLFLRDYPLTGSAVFSADDGVLSLTYEAEYERDNGGSDPPYFDVKKGTERREAGIRDMALTGDKAKNYVLVYNTNANAIGGIPHSHPTAQGTVKLRAMEKIEIVTDSNFRTVYTYGGQLLLNGMSLKITFESAGDNDPESNKVVKTQAYQSLISGGVIIGNSFANLGLGVSWSPGADEVDEEDKAAVLAWLNKPEWSAASGTYPTVKDHSGRQLTVYGRRYSGDTGGHPIVFATTAIQNGIVIHKKTLPLAVTPQNRYYGENNPAYVFTFQSKDLAKPDSEKLAGLGHALNGTAAATGIGATSAALDALGGYGGPKFTTAAVQTTNVGTYPLTLAGGEMDNYVFHHTNATIRIFRRPIIIDQITQNPIYKIYHNNPATEFQTHVDAAGFTARRPGDIYANQKDRDYVAVMGNNTLALSGDAVLGTDVSNRKISLNLQVNFPQIADREKLDGAVEVPQPVLITNLALAMGTGNYMVVYNDGEYETIGRPLTNTATAKLDLRNIKKIEVATVPQSVYTYGDTLDLSNLQVKITYMMQGAETESQVEIVRADSRDGVYVNYYNSSTVPANQSEWNTVKDNYRPAKNGDHLTIAPDHNTAFPNFGQANGKYLIVSAVAHDALGFVQPVVVPASVTMDGNQNLTPSGSYQVKVNPLALKYALAAADKTYDGNTKAVGTLTLTNAYNRDDVTDVVYTVTGAAYEKNSTNYLDYADFATHVAANGYHFSTGKYDSSAGTANGTLSYTGGSYGNGADKLTYAFVDPNVHYRDARDNVPKRPGDAGWDAYGELTTCVVEVTGIRLGGADAANYSINDSVLSDTVQESDRDDAPVATIHKAYRAAPLPAPKLEVDIHTNVVKTSMEKAAAQYNPTDWTDEFAAELHYEYRLEGWDAAGTAEGDTAAYTPGPAEHNYQDEAFFGGEPIEIPLPEGYEPSREPEPPKEGDPVKGQIYRWAEEDKRFGFDDTLFGLDENGQPLRAPLKRDQVYCARVRLAETHNFLPSEDTPSVSDGELAQAAQKAKEDAKAAADALIARAEGSMQHDKENPEQPPEPTAMVKTYPQRLTVISPAEETGKDQQRYTVETLEAVWFTDVLGYARKEVLNSVLDNFDPTRYYRYFWDVDKSGEVKFEADAPLDLSQELEVEIREKQPDSTTEEKTVTVNRAEPPEVGGHSADLYVTTQAEGGAMYIRSLEVTPTEIKAKVGDGPIQLEATYKPSYATMKTIKWASSDETVVTVDGKGLVTILAAGTATITVSTTRGPSVTVAVTVTDGSETVRGVFNTGYEKPFLTMTPDGAFLPERAMTRGELVTMLSRFYVESPGWTGTGNSDFPDLKGTEYYAPAAKLLGDKGIITGVSGGFFAAENTATRAEMAVILVRMMGLEIVDTKGRPHAFSDAGEKDTWAYAYIDALAKQGIIKGTGGGKFNPNGILSRAEAACMIARILEWEQGHAEEAPLKPIDVPANHWGYGEILQAVNGPTIATQKK